MVIFTEFAKKSDIGYEFQHQIMVQTIEGCKTWIKCSEENLNFHFAGLAI